MSLILDWDIFQEEFFYWYTIILYEHFVCWKVLLVGPFFSCKILIKWQASTYSTYHRCMYSCPSIIPDTDNTKLVKIIESILAPTKQVLPPIVRANLAHERVAKMARRHACRRNTTISSDLPVILTTAKTYPTQPICEDPKHQEISHSTSLMQQWLQFFFWWELAGRSARDYTNESLQRHAISCLLFSSAVSRARLKWCAVPMILPRSLFLALVSYADRTATPVGLQRDTHISDSSEILDRRARKWRRGRQYEAPGIFLDLIRFCCGSL